MSAILDTTSVNHLQCSIQEKHSPPVPDMKEEHMRRWNFPLVRGIITKMLR